MPHKANNEKQKSITKNVVLIGIILLVILNFTESVNLIKYLYGIISPLLLGGGIAFVVNILVSKYENIYFPESDNRIIIKMRRSMCIILSILTIMLVLLFLLDIVIPQITQFIQLLSTELPVIYEKVVEWTIQQSERYPVIRQRLEELDISGEAAINRALELFNSWAFGSVSFIGIVFSKIVELLLAIVFSIYILFDREALKGNYNKLINAYLSKDRREKLSKVIQTADETFSNFFLGQFKEAVILGLLCTIGMLIFGLPYATTIGSVVGLTALIPMVGAYLGAAVGVLLIAMVDLLKAVLFIFFIVVLQQVEGNFIYPKVIGNNIRLPSIWVFGAIIVGGGLMGILGVILGVPIAATIYRLIGKSVNERLISKD